MTEQPQRAPAARLHPHALAHAARPVELVRIRRAEEVVTGDALLAGAGDGLAGEERAGRERSQARVEAHLHDVHGPGEHDAVAERDRAAVEAEEAELQPPLPGRPARDVAVEALGRLARRDRRAARLLPARALHCEALVEEPVEVFAAVEERHRHLALLVELAAAAARLAAKFRVEGGLEGLEVAVE